MLVAIFIGLVLILFLLGMAVPYALGLTAVVGILLSPACRRWLQRWLLVLIALHYWRFHCFCYLAV